MTDCFPEMVMPPPEPEPEPLTDEVIQEQLDIEEAEQGAYEVEEIEDFEEEEVVPEPKRRPKIPQDEIFSPPKVKTILEPEPAPEPPPKKTGRGSQGQGTRKKRGPPSAEQLERLAKGRAKAAETRARKKKEREEAKAKEKADKELVEAVRERERQKLRKKLQTPIEEEDKPHLVPQVKVVETEKVVQTGYSQEQLDKAVAEAVEKSVNRVETLRKQRKAEKAKAQAKAKHDAAVFREVNRALKTSVWDDCFI